MKPLLSRSLLAISLAAVALPCSSCKTSISKLDAVEIPQTSVKNKKKIGFCWAYATTDFIESEFLKRTGTQLNLSEEYLGFYRIAEHIRFIINTKKEPQAILDEVSCQRFQGLHIMKSSETQRRGGFELAEKYGLVPEDAYNVKFEDEEHRTATFLGIKSRLEDLLKEKKPLEITDADIADVVISGKSSSISTTFPDESLASNYEQSPPQKFEYAGREWTPQTFFKEFVQIDLKGFVKHNYTAPKDYEKMVTLIKKTLASGTAVPFGFGVDRNHLFAKDGATIFSGKQKMTDTAGYSGPANPYESAADPLKGVTCPPKEVQEYQQGRHAVLITDFVNTGSQPGAELTPEGLQAQIDRPAADLDYVVIKNSWGIDEEGHEGDEAGSSWLSSRDGYYRVDKEYLLNSLAHGVAINITVPKPAESPAK